MTAMPNYAGLRQYRKARSTGTHVGVYDGGPAGMDTDGGRWQTVCEEHSSIISHETFRLARDWASAPEQWCEYCMGTLAKCLDCGHTFQDPDYDAAADLYSEGTTCPLCEGQARIV